MAKKGTMRMMKVALLILIILVIAYVFMKLTKKPSDPLMMTQGNGSPTINFSYCKKPQNINKPACRKYMGIDDAVIQTNDNQVMAVSLSGS